MTDPETNLLILAGGYGLRLGEVGRATPKALLEVDGAPVIEHVLARFAPLVGPGGRVAVVTNAKFCTALERWLPGCARRLAQCPPVRLLNDGSTGPGDRLGAVGDLAFAVREGSLAGADLVVVGSDNLFTEGQEAFVAAARGKPAAIATVELESPAAVSRFAEVRVAPDGRVRCFVEKPVAPEGRLAGTMLYYLSAGVLPLIDEYLELGMPPDRAGDFFAWLGSRVSTFAFPLAGRWIDIGTPEALEEARRAGEWR